MRYGLDFQVILLPVFGTLRTRQLADHTGHLAGFRKWRTVENFDVNLKISAQAIKSEPFQVIAVAGGRIFGVGQNADNNTVDLLLDNLNVICSLKAVAV